VHERGHVTLEDLEDRWSLEDLLEAHMALDVVDELNRKAHLPPPK
jgi:hypothetical protein